MSAAPAETMTIEGAQASYQGLLESILKDSSCVLAFQGRVFDLLSAVSTTCDRDKDHVDFPAFHVLRNSLEALNTAYTEALKDGETREHKAQSEAALLQACQGVNLQAWFAYIETKFKGSKIEFSVDAEADFSGSCIGPDLTLDEALDPSTTDTIKAMLENFLGNAARYSATGAPIEVSVGRNDEGAIVLSVANTAKALSEVDAAEHLTSGNGNRACGKKLDPLGFRISVDIAEAAGGRSVSRCVFPTLSAYQESKRAEDERLAKVEHEGSERKFPIQMDWCAFIDDESVQRRLFARKVATLLVRNKKNAHTFSSHDEYVAFCAEHRCVPGLVIMDTTGAGMDPKATISYTNSQVDGYVEFLRVTADSNLDLQQDSENAGAWLVDKSFRKSSFERVAKALKAARDSGLGTTGEIPVVGSAPSKEPVKQTEPADPSATSGSGSGSAPAPARSRSALLLAPAAAAAGGSVSAPAPVRRTPPPPGERSASALQASACRREGSDQTPRSFESTPAADLSGRGGSRSPAQRRMSGDPTQTATSALVCEVVRSGSLKTPGESTGDPSHFRLM